MPADRGSESGGSAGERFAVAEAREPGVWPGTATATAPSPKPSSSPSSISLSIRGRITRSAGSWLMTWS
jgi:hypothetical protein